MAWKHYFIREVNADPREPSYEVDSIEFTELGDGNIFARIQFPRRKGTQALGVSIPLKELEEAVRWLSGKIDSIDTAHSSQARGAI